MVCSIALRIVVPHAPSMAEMGKSSMHRAFIRLRIFGPEYTTDFNRRSVEIRATQDLHTVVTANHSGYSLSGGRAIRSYTALFGSRSARTHRWRSESTRRRLIEYFGGWPPGKHSRQVNDKTRERSLAQYRSTGCTSLFQHDLNVSPHSDLAHLPSPARPRGMERYIDYVRNLWLCR